MKKIYFFIAIFLISLINLTGCSKKYTVTFVDHDGTTLQEVVVKKGSTVTEPTSPSRDGYTFVGWDNDLSNITSDVIINAVYKKNQYTITFDTDGGSKIDQYTLDYKNVVVAPNNPTKEGYVFIGWDKEIPSNMPAENLTFKAVWSPIQCTITFNDPSIESIKAKYDQTITLPTLEKEGHIFNGWLYNDELYNGEIVVKGNMELTPSFTANTYVVTVDLCNDLENVTFEFAYGQTLSDLKISLIPSYEGYRFNELYYDSEYKNIVKYRKSITEDFTIYVKWDKIYKIEYNLNEGYITEDLPSEYIEEDVKYLDLEFKNPKKDGYYFRGWYENPNFEGNRCYKIDINNVRDYVLYAKWEVANLQNAYLSIIGDSISTYEGYIPKGHIHFPEYSSTGSVSVNQTWWKKTVSNLGCRLGVNNSYSGTCVMDAYGAYTSSETVQRLRKCMRSDNIPPDIIVVFMGMNDCLIENVSVEQFAKSYENMIKNLQELYPDAVLFFATISYEVNYESKGAEALKKHLDSKAEMNEIIRNLAKQYDYPVIEFASAFNSREFLLDTVHTNYKGMEKFAEVATKTIKEYYENK